ncbi:LCP family glycopolymer transferase [Nocardiopsis lambiniae]|uniref:LCP family protein n=1 Tax=Nocardiopsis lambiniae TaxID=3075539 RepID=A0ABU2MAZ9_9ACTN|nr:LCP family protein [Nocardiopsis sp. DSM 44743]MDT0329854.1 LCP family protein [Nocardiopsis sp. DSM 44743]
MTADENVSATAGADTLPEPEKGPAHTTERAGEPPDPEPSVTESGGGIDPTTENGPRQDPEPVPGPEPARGPKRAEPVWRIGRSGRLERVGDAPDDGYDEDDVMALVNATATTGARAGNDAPGLRHASGPKHASENDGTDDAKADAPSSAQATGRAAEHGEPDPPAGAGGSGGSGGEGPPNAPVPAAPGGGGGDGRRRRRLRRAVAWTAAGLAVVLTAGVATAYGYYHSLRSGMVRHDLEAALDEGERPEKINDAVNILFMGSDGYEEGSTAYSSEFEGERSDSIMLAHISPDDRVSVISFPRDSLVDLPQCDPYGTAQGTYGYFGMINAAMYHGGPPCVVRTIETLTDIRVDHFVHLSFMSFRDVVDAIGGVDICIPEPIKDERSKLDLDAGEQTLDGDQALSFVRARYEIGDGGDIGRIDRQQMFMAALADQAMRGEVLGNPSRLHGILTAVAQHSATDEQLTLDRMLSIAVSLSDVDLSDIEFHTVPWYQAPFDPNRILWYEDRAAELFEAVREDRPLPSLVAADDAPVPLEPPGASPSAVDSPSAVASPSPDLPAARAGEGRDATSDPCSDGLGFGTNEEFE